MLVSLDYFHASILPFNRLSSDHNADLGSIQYGRLAMLSAGRSPGPSLVIVGSCRRTISRMDKKLGSPVRATLTASVFDAIYELLYRFSMTAPKSISTSTVVFVSITIATSQTMLVYRGRDNILLERFYNMCRLGRTCNTFALGWVPVLTILACMSPAWPIAAGSFW